MGAAFVETLPVARFHGIGPATAERMHALGIQTGLDLRAQSQEFLREHFGKSGDFFSATARGDAHRPVCANRDRKSVGAENTFEIDLFAYPAAHDALQPIIDKVWSYCARNDIRARTVTLKVKYEDFTQV